MNKFTLFKRCALGFALMLHTIIPSIAQPLRGAQDLLLPRPQRIQTTGGMLMLRGVNLKADALRVAYKAYLSEHNIPEGMHYRTNLNVRLVDSLLGIPHDRQEEGYTLEINSQGINIEATHEQGAYWALQTLRQLSTRGSALPLLRIEDWAEWHIRGVMIDVGRTFVPLEELKKQVKLLSSFKINVFHWHLTENQAWRLESKLYPALTSIAATERMPGQYYTLEEAKEFAQWCKAHNVLLIPEIDMPGHSAAFERALGYGMQTPEGKTTLKALLREAISAMDVPYIHLGTDEVEFTDPSFVPEMVAYVRSMGKKVISWNPGWNYKPNEIDLLQMWSYRGNNKGDIPAIDSRLHYINHYDTFSDLIALYNARIARIDRATESLKGAILALWNDRYLDTTEQMIADNHLWATSLALAERAWQGGGKGYFDGKTTMLWDRSSQDFKDFEDFEHRLLYYKQTLLKNEPIPYVKQTHASWQIIGQFPNGGDLGKSFPLEQSLLQQAKNRQTPPKQLLSYQYEGQTYTAQQLSGSGFYLRHVWGENISPGVFKKAQPDHTAYAVAWVQNPSPKPLKAGLYFETQNYSRSEKDLPPPQGAWDYRQSRLWLNGNELTPGTWTATHSTLSNEIPLGNENASSRPPLSITLRPGWNMLLVKLPIGKFSTRETRLVKWMFSASIVSQDGKEALPLKYHIARP